MDVEEQRVKGNATSSIPSKVQWDSDLHAHTMRHLILSNSVPFYLFFGDDDKSPSRQARCELKVHTSPDQLGP